jgi:hypothetical protein
LARLAFFPGGILQTPRARFAGKFLPSNGNVMRIRLGIFLQLYVRMTLLDISMLQILLCRYNEIASHISLLLSCVGIYVPSIV